MIALDWAEIEPNLAELIGDLALLPRAESGAPAVTWDDAARPFGLAAGAFLSVASQSQIGTTATDWLDVEPVEAPFGSSYGGAAVTLNERAMAHQAVTVRVRFECYAHTPGANARSYASALLARLEWQSTLDALDALGLGFLSAGDIQEPSRTYDDRVRSIAQIDLRFNAINVAIDETETHTIGRADFRRRTT